MAVFIASIRLKCGGLLVLECKHCNLLLTPLTPIISAQRRKCCPAAAATLAEDVCTVGGAAEEAEGEVQIHPAADFVSCQA
jgi:hypothetical protein